ncbi:MAG: thiamine pyrophosphate-dependent enzyme, partial [Anaerolineae bacterium]
MAQGQIDWLHVAHLLLASRELDILEVEKLTPAGNVKYQFSAMGHELAQILLALHLTHPHDAATVYYRSRPFMLASGLTPREALAAGMARTGSPSEGRDVGVTFSLPRRTGATALPMSGDVGAQYTPAAGWAQSILYRTRVLGDDAWRGAIAVAQGGEGSVAANGFWAALNMAAVLDLPLLFSIEDNEYGLSVPGDCQTPGGNIAANLACFPNLKTFDGDGADPADAATLIAGAVRHVRDRQGPALLRLRVPRLLGHTYVDDQAYKPPEQMEEEEARDPLPRLRAYLLEEGHLTADEWDEIRDSVRARLKHALALASTNPEPDPAQATRYLFYDGVITPEVGGLRREDALPPPGDPTARPDGPRINLVDAVRRTLESEMERNVRILVFGEDVGVKGGVHGATRGMQSKFGWERVFDTSLSEEGIVGRALGMALAGLLPVPEIQFRKYT